MVMNDVMKDGCFQQLVSCLFLPGNPKQLADVTSHPLHKLPVACQVNKDYLEARCHRVTSWYNEFKGISMDSRNWGV